MNRKVIGRYYVNGPNKEVVTSFKHTITKDENGVARIEREEVSQELDCWHVVFPKGHSIRVTSIELLKELGFDRKPRLVDAETGDVVDMGGDPFDFVHEAPKSGGRSRASNQIAA